MPEKTRRRTSRRRTRVGGARRRREPGFTSMLQHKKIVAKEPVAAEQKREEEETGTNVGAAAFVPKSLLEKEKDAGFGAGKKKKGKKKNKGPGASSLFPGEETSSAGGSGSASLPTRTGPMVPRKLAMRSMPAATATVASFAPGLVDGGSVVGSPGPRFPPNGDPSPGLDSQTEEDFPRRPSSPAEPSSPAPPPPRGRAAVRAPPGARAASRAAPARRRFSGTDRVPRRRRFRSPPFRGAGRAARASSSEGRFRDGGAPVDYGGFGLGTALGAPWRRTSTLSDLDAFARADSPPARTVPPPFAFGTSRAGSPGGGGGVSGGRGRAGRARLGVDDERAFRRFDFNVG